MMHSSNFAVDFSTKGVQRAHAELGIELTEAGCSIIDGVGCDVIDDSKGGQCERSHQKPTLLFRIGVFFLLVHFSCIVISVRLHKLIMSTLVKHKY